MVNRCQIDSGKLFYSQCCQPMHYRIGRLNCKKSVDIGKLEQYSQKSRYKKAMLKKTVLYCSKYKLSREDATEYNFLLGT